MIFMAFGASNPARWLQINLIIYFWYMGLSYSEKKIML